jgi:hypothetical protein
VQHAEAERALVRELLIEAVFVELIAQLRNGERPLVRRPCCPVRVASSVLREQASVAFSIGGTIGVNSNSKSPTLKTGESIDPFPVGSAWHETHWNTLSRASIVSWPGVGLTCSGLP